MTNSNHRIKYIGITAIIFFMIGFSMQHVVGFFLKETPATAQSDMDLFWQTWEVLDEKYPFQEPSREEKIYAAIGGLVESYQDQHMAFFPPMKSQSFAEDIAGEFGGAGMEVSLQSGYVVVVAPLKGSPADRAGIEPGDVILKINGLEAADVDFETAVSLIRGEVGTTVELEIVRQNEEDIMLVSLVREVVKIPILDTEIIDDVFTIHFYTFSEQSEQAFKEALLDFKKSGASTLLIDVRNNPGGFLTSAINITSHFLDQGLTVVKEYDGNGIDYTQATKYRSTGYDTLKGVDYNLAVLINRGSASASEILAGALRDHNLATIYGQQSFGKGSVQELIDLPQETSLKVTISKWLTPNDMEISGQGVEPDILIEEDLFIETVKLLNAEN